MTLIIQPKEMNWFKYYTLAYQQQILFCIPKSKV